jgi:glucose-6-phosphate isomerase
MTRLEIENIFTLSASNVLDDQTIKSELKAHAKGLFARKQAEAFFLSCPEMDITSILDGAATLAQRFKRMLVLGIGGSALGTVAALEALQQQGRAREVLCLSNLDPFTVGETLDRFDPHDTLLCCVTKSGSTVETLVQLEVFAKKIYDTFGKTGLAQRLVIITDPNTGPARRIATSLGCPSFEVPPRLGGRFSVLSPVGLFPLAFAGIDCESLLLGAGKVFHSAEASLLEEKPLEHPSLFSAFVHASMFTSRPVRVLWAYADRLQGLVQWFCQLWAESLGKDGKGQTPVGAIGSTDQHSLLQLFIGGPEDKCYTFLTLGNPLDDLVVPSKPLLDEAISEFAGKTVFACFDALRMGTMAALLQKGFPVLRIHIPSLDATALGAIFAHFELETALSGFLLGVDPFDQPGVEAGKAMAHGLLGRADKAHLGLVARKLLGEEKDE